MPKNFSSKKTRCFPNLFLISVSTLEPLWNFFTSEDLIFTFGKFLSYIIVSIITFIAIIIVLDTFKDPLSNIFPNLELVLYNLFETLRDLILFAKDLN